MNEKLYETAFDLIMHAGNSKSLSMKAIRAARESRFTEFEELMNQAREEMCAVHDVQTEMLQMEANGKTTEVSIIMIHALDHLTMALMTLDQAQEMKELYKKIYDLTKKVEGNY